MTFISENQHGTFLRCLDESIQKFEKDIAGSSNAPSSLLELKDDGAELAAIYYEYHNSIDQLRSLVAQYKQAQKKARLKLRGIQLTYLRQLKTRPRETSFTKTHKSIL